MKKLVRFIVISQTGAFVCGPFATYKKALEYADIYSKSAWFGECSVKEYTYNV